MPYSQDLYERNLVEVAVTGRPLETIVYGIFVEFIMSKKNPSQRFILSPQLNLKWKPDHHRDKRAEIPDFGIGHFTLPGTNPTFKLRCGVEAKRAMDEMATLPAPESLIENHRVDMAFHSLYFQVMDQAKAAYKNDYPLCEDGVHWILLVGPYWISEKFGPFTEAETTVRGKKQSDSGDYKETVNILSAMNKIRKLRPGDLYILNSKRSSDRLEEILKSTDQVARPYIDAMSWAA